MMQELRFTQLLIDSKECLDIVRYTPLSGAQLEIFEGRVLIHKTGHTKICLKRIQLYILFFRFRNGRNIIGIFLDSIHSSLIMITPIHFLTEDSQFAKKKGTLILLKKRTGIQTPRTPRRCAPDCNQKKCLRINIQNELYIVHQRRFSLVMKTLTFY